MRPTLCAGAALTALLTAPALSQTDTITVTSIRAESAAERLPASVSIIDREEIELDGVATLADLLKDEPGVSAVQNGPAGSLTSVFIRGANSKHTLALYDGIRLNDPSTATGVFNFGSDLLGDAGRIEIVRGPLSSLYGSDAIGGVINILPRSAPETGFQPFAEASVGEFNTIRALAGAGYGGERVRGVITAETFESDGYDVTPARIATATGDPDGASVDVITASGEIDLTDSLRLDALIRRREAVSEFDTFSGGPTGFQRADDPDLETRDDQTLWALGLHGATPNGALETRIRGGQVIYDLESLDGAAITDTYEAERDFAQASLAWRPRGADVLIDPLISAGLDWQDERIDTDTAFNNPLSVSEDTVSLYAAVQGGLTEALTVTASARYDDYEAFGGQTTGNIGAVYALPALSTRLRASYGTSFKAPTLSERFASSAFVTPNPDLEPEEGETVEIGFDTTLETVAFGAAWYDGAVENLIENVFDFTTFTGTNRNIGQADLSGWEAYAEWTPIDALTLAADYTYTDAINADTGARLQRRPGHAWSARAVVRPSDFAALTVRYNHVGERRDVTYDDAGFFIASGQIIDGYQTVDLTGTLDLGDSAQLFLSATNLLDETYEQPASFAGAPRAVTIGLRWRPEAR
ncbi:MAG: TonB-dependent receptor [Alphaproteobacteria bacterium]|nr:TonB-dependent receptor [Alphaproteobacteria bacterium]